MNYFRSHILIETDEAAVQAGVRNITQAMKNELMKHGLANEVNVLETGSLGFFEQGICIAVYPENVIYGNIKLTDVPELIEEHFVKGRTLQRLVLEISEKKDIPLEYAKRIVLENSGIINPEEIYDYFGIGGYSAWEKALLEMTPDEIVQTVKDSGLRGRGGAGFPCGVKWSFTAPLKDEQKYMVINADEGEPGTFKDRLIMEGDPHKLLEGTMIAARAIGANEAFIYIRGEYKLCIARLNKAIKQAEEYGY